jgi:aryl-alcohol dehydrogenase-like predicted oxidoreductase
MPALERQDVDKLSAVAIPTRTLGRTGAEVTVLGYGAMELRGEPRGPALEDADAGRLLNAVLDEGITLIDTSIDYGRSEELIGRHLSSRRDEYFLASKCGCLPTTPADATPPYPHNYTAANVRAGVEQSLRRLQTDHLDLVQVHMSPSREQLESDGTLEEMVNLRDEGKVRFLGISGIKPNLADHIAMGVFDVFQIPYSALQRGHEGLISQAAQSGAGVLIRGGVARGTASEDKAWSVRPLSGGDVPAEATWQAARLDELLEDGTNRHEFILRFTLSLPGLSSTIVGTSDRDHLRGNVATASRGPLPADVHAEAVRRLDAVG